MDVTHDLALGPLSVRTWAGGAGDPVLALHGISSNNRLWLWMHELAPDITLLAPDLAGRGDSPAPPAPSGLARHADQLAQLLDALGLDRVHVMGMSMGGFVAMELAARHPGRVRTVTLLDGGLPLTTRTDREAMAPVARRTWYDPNDYASVQAYVDHYVATTAPLLDRTDPLLAEFLAHDLTGGEAGGRQRRSLDTIVDDGLDVFSDDGPDRALDTVAAPVRLVHAQWSIGRDTAPMYPAEHVAACAARSPGLVSTELIEGVDHAATIMTRPGASACVRALRANLSG